MKNKQMLFSLMGIIGLTAFLSGCDFFKGDELLIVLPSQFFTSAWQSAGTGDEWVHVDFGAPASFDKVNLHWM